MEPMNDSQPRIAPNKDSNSPFQSRVQGTKLRPVADVINRLIWDENFDSTQYIIGYEDRFDGLLEASLGSWKRESTDEEFIPQHRILYIKRGSDSGIIWDKRQRIDKIFYSGNSASDGL